MFNLSLSNERPLLVGLTGGIGSGKTVVCELFEALHVSCFHADPIAGSYYQDPNFCKLLLPIFGTVIFDERGIPDKKKIASIVFSDKAKLDQLNNLIHPRVFCDFEKWVLQHSNEPYLIQESAILFEYGFEKFFDKIICVSAPKSVRMRRVMKRDSITYEAVEARMKNQMDEEEKCKKANFVITNYKGEKYRRMQVEKLHTTLLTLSEKKRL